MDLPHLPVGGEHQWLPELRLVTIEGAPLENADDAIRFAVEQDLPAQNLRVGPKVVLPGSVTDDKHTRGSGLVLFSAEGAAQPGARGKHPEVIGGDGLTGEADWLALGVDCRGDRLFRRQGFENRAQPLPVQKVRGAVCIRDSWPRSVPHANDAVRFRKGKGLEEDAIDDAEHGDVGTHAEGQHANHDGGEAGSTQQ